LRPDPKERANTNKTKPNTKLPQMDISAAAESVGITSDCVKVGANADWTSPFKALTAAQEAAVDDHVGMTYQVRGWGGGWVWGGVGGGYWVEGGACVEGEGLGWVGVKS